MWGQGNQNYGGQYGGNFPNTNPGFMNMNPGYNQGYNPSYNQGYNQGYGQSSVNQFVYPPRQTYGWGVDRDAQLRNYIDQIFYKYDVNRSGALTQMEFIGAYGEICQLMGMPVIYNHLRMQHLASSIDTDCNGQISKYQLFNAFKKSHGYY